ncbi:exosortase system-associated protein, TIGR04073 family [Methylosarcina fibrata]|uniref:exosortase system-associated protein, TIGR04073 family n=1 Tax=Methylosarcina fibrata TaxID=105972 RepID=UPI00035F8F5B|nr:exosortase system-associated protein, TIGR04073 family [Methylosarcina fibrata]
MLKFNRVLLIASIAISTYASMGHAGESEQSYMSQVSGKFTRGFANLFTGLGEVPKNIVDASKKTNPVVGGTGGLIMGTLDTLGRTTSGIFDVITSPIPTKSLVQPEYVWQDFDHRTSYGDAYKVTVGPIAE